MVNLGRSIDFIEAGCLSAGYPQYITVADSLDQVTNGIVILGKDRKIKSANQVFQRMSGYNIAELRKMELSNFIGCQERLGFLRSLFEILQGKKNNYSEEFLLYRKDGSSYWANLSFSRPLEIAAEPEIVLMTIQDRSQQTSKTEDLETFINLPVSLFCIIDFEGNICKHNPSFLQVLGYEQEEVMGKNISSFIHPGDVQKTVEARDRVVRQGESTTEYVNRCVCKDGSIRWLEWTVCCDLSNRLLYCTSKDITGRIKLHNQVRDLEEGFTKAINFSPVMMAITDIETGRFVDVNQTYAETLGYQQMELIGKTAEELCIYRDQEDQAAAVAQVLQGGSSHNIEVILKTKDNKYRTTLFSVEMVEMNGKKYFLSAGKDITEREEMHQAMAKLDRLNTIAEIAAGIGHEVRNPMTTVRGFLQVLAGKDTIAANGEYYDLMIGELDRANYIITEFLSLAKTVTLDLSLQDLNKVIEAMVPLLEANARLEDKNVIVDLQPIPLIPIDDKQIRQVVLNLARNALEASESGSSVTIKTYKEASKVVMAIQDQGNGIEPDILAKLGTPFVTSKDHGTGLGMAVCYSIAGRHGAVIEVDTGPEGTTFFIKFETIEVNVDL